MRTPSIPGPKAATRNRVAAFLVRRDDRGSLGCGGVLALGVTALVVLAAFGGCAAFLDELTVSDADIPLERSMIYESSNYNCANIAAFANPNEPRAVELICDKDRRKPLKDAMSKWMACQVVSEGRWFNDETNAAWNLDELYGDSDGYVEAACGPMP